MCGISGLYELNKLSESKLKKFITSSKSHHGKRGPDNFDSFISADRAVVLTHSRLSLIDPSEAGHQPMRKHGRVIVFNGEVYNFRSIRSELERIGYTFLSYSDTEVILSAYDKWGKDCFNRFNGPLAAAIYDEATKELVLARDRVGEKPLYYYVDTDESAVYFGSTIRQIMHTKQKAWELNEDRIVSDLIFNFWSDKTHSHIKGINNIPAGSVYVVNTTTNDKSLYPYWTLNPIETENDEQTIIETVDTLLRDAVAIRTQLDAPIGAILSGGIDSTLLASIAKEQLEYPLNCFTLSRNDHIDEDLFYAKKYCHEFSLPHTEVKLADADLGVEAFIASTREMEEPSLDQVYLYISRNYETARANNLKAVLNGQGADEIFLGYLDYYDFLRDEKNYQNQKALEAYWMRQSPLKNVLDISNAKRIISENLNRNYAPYATHDMLNSVLRFGVKTHLPALLAQEDKQSMRWSVECRTVFTDYRLVEYMSSVPSNIKKLDNREKYILRQIAKLHLPEYIINRKKLGFPDLPDNRKALIDTMISDGLLKDSEVLSRILEQKTVQYPDDLPLNIKWKLCSIAILERGIL